MGTAQYLSPEQAQGKETTERSDIYSIGVILYEALTGRVPFEGDSAVAVALKQVSEQPRRPSAVNPKVPPALDAVVMRALAKDPEARFINADAFLKALDAAELAPDQPRPEDTAAFAAVGPRRDAARRGGRGVGGLRRARAAPLVALGPDRAARGAVAGGHRLPADGQRPLQGREGRPVRHRPGRRRRRPSCWSRRDSTSTSRPARTPRRATPCTEQDPIAGETVEEGSTIVLTVSSGPAIVEVPNVAGLTETAGDRDRLEEAGLRRRTRIFRCRRDGARGPRRSAPSPPPGPRSQHRRTR